MFAKTPMGTKILMSAKRLLILSVILSLGGLERTLGQGLTCTTLGQTPETAFPVCGTSTFQQANVPICGGTIVPVACSDAQYSDKNPFWYKFTCFTGGTLGFEVTPNTLSDDYDWQLFDVTGQPPSAVYTNASLFVSGNWSSNPGATGASAGASGNVNCAGPTYPNQNAMPTLIQGHNYILLVSHFTNSQSGYSLSFSGGTASITDTTAPKLLSAQASCDGTQVSVFLNKKMTCASLDPNGSDFVLSPSPVNIQSASGNGCSTGFDMDTVILTLSGTLTPGNYTVTAQDGGDGNTLLDNCGSQVPVGYSVSFNKPTAPQPTPLDSIAPPGCAPQVLTLVFSKAIRCSSFASDGSEFSVTGPTPVVVTGASGTCDGNGLTPVIKVQLSAPIQTGGTYTITLVNGGNGTTIVDECGQTTPAGSSINFITGDTVSATFIDQVILGCRYDTIAFTYPEKDGVNQWQWTFNNSDTSLMQNPLRIYSDSVPSQITVQLLVSNGVCSDTASTAIALDNGIQALFEAPNILCPKDMAVFRNNSTGNIISWNWNFGDGSGSTLQLPPDHLFPLTGVQTLYNVSLVVGNNFGCTDTAVQQIDVLRSCYIAVPSAFTPNGDGVNDYLYPLNAYNADNLDFKVFNRYGQLVFETTDWTKKWDGTVGGRPEPPGTFVWILKYTDRDTGKNIFQKGTTILIR
jgi:gliding motility-associated-like protein